MSGWVFFFLGGECMEGAHQPKADALLVESLGLKGIAGLIPIQHSASEMNDIGVS